MNKYKTMLCEFIKVKSDFEKYENKCIEVDLSLMREQLPQRQVILLHILVERYCPDLILSSITSHGGVDCMKLKAPKEEIAEGLEILLLHYEEENNSFMLKLISELIKNISKSNKNMISLTGILKQIGDNQ